MVALTNQLLLSPGELIDEARLEEIESSGLGAVIHCKSFEKQTAHERLGYEKIKKMQNEEEALLHLRSKGKRDNFLRKWYFHPKIKNVLLNSESFYYGF